MADGIRQIFLLTAVNFRRWRKSPQIWLAFGLGFVACFLLTNKTVLFAQAHDTVMQIFEPFIWTFGDAKSILLISLCLLLLFADMPSLGADVPLMLIRTTRRRWMAAQILSGGLMLGAIFMATDYVTSPITKLGQVVYGIGCGVLTVVIRYFGGYPEGVSYAILIMNCCVVLLDRIGRPKKFGSMKKEVAAK